MFLKIGLPSPLKSSQNTFADFSQLKKTINGIKAARKVVINEDSQPSNDKFIFALQEDVPVKLLYFKGIRFEPTTIFRGSRN